MNNKENNHDNTNKAFILLVLALIVCIFIVYFTYPLIKENLNNIFSKDETEETSNSNKSGVYLTISDCGEYVTFNSDYCESVATYYCNSEDCEGMSNSSKSNYVVVFDNKFLLYDYINNETVSLGNITNLNLTDDMYLYLEVIADDTQIYGYLIDTDDSFIYDYYSYETGRILYKNETIDGVIEYDIEPEIVDASNIDAVKSNDNSNGYLLVRINDIQNGSYKTQFVNLITGDVEYTFDYYYELD